MLKIHSSQIIQTSQEIDMKLGPVTKNLTRETRQRQKKLTVTSCRQIVKSLAFSQFMANLQPSVSRMQDAWSITLTIPSIATFYLTKSENRTEKSLTQVSCYCFEYRSFFCKKMLIFCKRSVDTSKINGVLVLKLIFFETTYVCVRVYQV